MIHKDAHWNVNLLKPEEGHYGEISAVLTYILHAKKYNIQHTVIPVIKCRAIKYY